MSRGYTGSIAYASSFSSICCDEHLVSCFRDLYSQVAQVAALIVTSYWRTCRIGLAHRLINFLPKINSGIAPSSHMAAPKFSPALIVLFNCLPFWLLPSVIVETGCLRCRLHPVTSNSTTRQSGLQSVYVLGWTCVSPPLPMRLASRRSRSA